MLNTWMLNTKMDTLMLNTCAEHRDAPLLNCSKKRNALLVLSGREVGWAKRAPWRIAANRSGSTRPLILFCFANCIESC